MKKSITIFLSIFAAIISSCTAEPFLQEDGTAGTATVTFTADFGTYPSGPDTKAFANTPNVRNLYLAVFNKDGKALVEYVKAEPVTLATENTTRYAYTATLKTSNKPRVIHFIANAPEEIGYGSDVDAVGNLSYSFDKATWEGDDAYWGYLKLDNGICKDTDPGFSELEAALSGVTLVRNFARIQVAEAEGGSNNFHLTRFWISNFPESSSAAPYNRSQRRFETGYAAYQSASAALAAGYQGFCPASSALVTLEGLSESRLDKIQCLPGTAAYSYEREKPTSDPLCIIVGGTSDLSPTETFYKIDLRDSEGNYIPLLRNFIYKVQVGNVYKAGEPTVEAALNSVSSGAIDTDLSLQGLKDLSNGKSRIAVSETERVLFDDEPFELRYSFVPDIVNDPSYIENKTLAQWVSEGYYSSEAEVLAAQKPYVSITFEPGMSGNVIADHSISDTDETDGYRKVTLTPVPTGDVVKTEVVTVTGYVWNSVKGGYETIQRTVNYQMRKRLDMVLTLSPDRVEKKVGESLTLTIGLEENLPKSLFTIDLKITTDQMTLTPVDNALSISSEVGADGKPAFFMKKAITWEEYEATPSVMDSDGILRKHFSCQFMTNTDNFRPVDPSFGDGDRLYVKSEDFNTASIFFIAGDDTKNRFVNPHLDKDYLVAGRPANIVFGMTKLPSDGKVFVRLNGLEPADTGRLTWIEDETIGEFAGYAVYSLDVSSASSESFAVKGGSDANSGYFQLFHDEFNSSAKYEYVVQKASFSDLKFNYNGLDYVVAGKQALACFHMDYTPLDGKVTLHLKNAVPVDGSLTGTGPDTDGYTSYVIEAGTNDVSLPVRIAPELGENTAYFKLTADNFNNSAVIGAPIQKLNFSKLKLINLSNTAANYVIGGRPARIAFTLDDMPGDNVITISLTGLTLGSGMSGVSAVTDNGDGSYNLTVTGTNVTLDVTPTVGEATASYELTDSEFNDATINAEIRKLNFSSLRIANEYSSGMTYLIGGRQARIYFGLEELPADGTITLTLTGLTPDSLDPASGKMSGISAISGSDGVYELTVGDTSVSIDVTPTVGVASAKVDLTDDEFYDSSCSATVSKLNFSGLTIANASPDDGDKDYLIIGNAARISFSMDDVPLDGKVSIKLYGMTSPAAVSGISAIEPKGSDEYELTVTGKNVTLDATVAAGATSAGFNLIDPEFLSSGAQYDKIWTRYTINWADVLIKGRRNTTVAAAANMENVEVYDNGSCTGTPVWTLTTDGSGRAQWTSPSVNIDTNDGSIVYYFKFTDSIGEYKSGAVTLAALAAQAGAVVECVIQVSTLNIASGKLNIKLGGDDKYDACTISWTTQSGYNGRFTVKKKSGKNTEAIAIPCTDSEFITFTTGSYSGSFKRNQISEGSTINLTL